LPGKTRDIEIEARIKMPEETGELRRILRGEEHEYIYIPRRAGINRTDAIRFRFTVGCAGCRAISRGQPAQNHSEGCRIRIEAELEKEGDQRLERAKKRLSIGEEQEEMDDDKRKRGQNTQEGKEVEPDSQDRGREVQGGEVLDDAQERGVKRSRTEDGPGMDIDTLEDRDSFQRQARMMGWSDNQGRWLMGDSVSREDQEQVMEDQQNYEGIWAQQRASDESGYRDLFAT
jgi:hypothetical protein